MTIQLIPLLTAQQNLYRQPLGLDRFREYLQTLLKADKSDVDLLPMMMMNPMGKQHVADYVDASIAMDAEAIAEDAIASFQLGSRLARFKLGLAVADDQKGGWTNRFSSDFAHRFHGQAQLKRHWISVIFWPANPRRLTPFEPPCSLPCIAQTTFCGTAFLAPWLT